MLPPVRILVFVLLASATSVYQTYLSLPHAFSCSFPLSLSFFFSVFILKDCDRPGRACMTISCSLGPQSKEEALSIDIKLLLNTEILKRVRNMSQQLDEFPCRLL